VSPPLTIQREEQPMEAQDAPLQLDPRELSQVLHARSYAEHFAHAGAPGHGQFLLIDKLSRMLDEARTKAAPAAIQKLVRDEANNCWRDVITGVKVDMP
jgi:hypothetical protein